MSDDRCSQGALVRDEHLAATAPVAQGWVVLEQPGPWGSKALQHSHLDPELGATLADASAGTGTTVLLARRPGRHADLPDARPRRFWVAHTSPGGVRMRTGAVDDPRRLLDWNLDAIAHGELPPAGRSDGRAVLFVCTNARRDLCCALAGRPTALALAARTGWADRVWESSHLGGHRFAATALLLPWGHVHGRLDAASAAAVLAGADTNAVPLVTYRGRTALRRPCQAAETAVRSQLGLTTLDDLDVLLVAGDRAVPVRPGPEPAALPAVVDTEVRHRDGRAWRVAVTQVPLPARPESCGKDPVDGVAWRAADPVPVAPWR